MCFTPNAALQILTNMTIFLLSDTEHPNPVLRERLQKEIAAHGNKIAYISSEPQDERREYFGRTADEYAAISKDISLAYFDLSDAYSDEALARLADFGVIHLSGGNTFAFLDTLRKRNIKPLLERHLHNGGLIIGVSAGSIVMTPAITTASVGDGDVNAIGMTDLTGLGFVDFSFLPHFYNTERGRALAKEYSVASSATLYACSDNDGVFVHAEAVEPLGDVRIFQK